eukprot:CAMPEP_0205921242 /NCGR_PEP_ID=MMETSP1325-20131115/12521_1 /ASSEMBLY_ACC=CAM_ASM_000708 /TAXON_ID=236786 /ORGANISM="Florenciella sp., Strain RCC1007" /LENGTH=126 /DNA_ID=CAMNT_0053289025 /DNA_START=317 /DNA_END=697 /DNA_ORIENTATION=-
MPSSFGEQPSPHALVSTMSKFCGPRTLEPVNSTTMLTNAWSYCELVKPPPIVRDSMPTLTSTFTSSITLLGSATSAALISRASCISFWSTCAYDPDSTVGVELKAIGSVVNDSLSFDTNVSANDPL